CARHGDYGSLFAYW
nr:immunoglobulin heavy chain junction region [Mus musculus]